MAGTSVTLHPEESFTPSQGLLLEYQHTLICFGKESEGILKWFSRDVDYKVGFQTRGLKDK